MNRKIIPIMLFLLICGVCAASPDITINQPYPNLASGENVVLDVFANETISLNYSLNYVSKIFAGTGTSFIKLLNGTLAHGILDNGDHNITLWVIDSFGNVDEYEHNFNVDDSYAPNLTINASNGSKHNGSAYLFWLRASTDEFAFASYKLNTNAFSNVTGFGNAKAKVYNLSLVEGQNNITFNVTDYHNNSAIYSYSINYSQVYVPTCYDAIQNGDETGLDCGGGCGSCVEFSISSDSPSYNLTDSVSISVLARANSTVNMTIRLNNEVSYRHLFVPVFPGFPLSEKKAISNTTNAGNYTIFARLNYLNTSEYKNATFEIIAAAQNPLSVTINANATTVNEGNTVQFSSAVSSNISAVTYKWDFQNDGIIDSTEPSAQYTFQSNGTFKVNLTVSDTKWNQSDLETITARKLHNFTVLVRNNATQAVLPNAEIKVEDATINTSSEGRSDFTKPEGNYDIVVKKPGFATFSNKTSIKGYALIEVYLAEQDISDPVIQLISPENAMTVNNNSVKLVYRASDISMMTCSLFTSKNSQSWIRQATDSFVQPGSDSNFTISLDNASYSWQIECFDRAGNINSSEVFSFTSDQSVIENLLSVDLSEQDRISEEITVEMDQILSEIDAYNADEKDAAEAMQLKKQIEKAKIEVQRANRDLHSLKWRRLNETELEEETLSILERVEKLRYTTPRKITILEKNEFVKYPSKDDVQAALEPLIKKTNLRFTRKELRNLVDENFKHQSLITVTTKARLIEVEFMSEDSNQITLVEKSVTGKDDTGELSFLEVIPKEVADNASKINALFDFEIVEEDPILKIDIGQFKDFAYYIEGKTDLKDIERIKSVLVDEKIKKKETGFFTGFATGFVPTSGFAGGLISGLNVRLVIELVVIVVLGLLFMYYQYGGYEKLELVLNRKLSHQMKEFDYLFVRISNYLDQGKYDESKILYNEINELFKQMPKERRAKLYPSIMDIHARMDYIFMDNSLSEAFAALDDKDAKKALRLYGKISGLYKSLPKDYKSKIHARCIELYRKLNT